MRNKPQITVVVGKDALFTRMIPTEIDEKKSVSRYVGLVARELRDQYRGSDVQVFYDPHITRSIHLHGHDMLESDNIRSVLDTIHVRMEWLVYK